MGPLQLPRSYKLYSYYYCYYYYYYSNSLFHSISTGSQNSTGVTDQALLIHCSAQNFLTVRRVLSITTFCIRIQTAGRRLAVSNFRIICFE